MIRPHNHEGIINLPTRELSFRIDYKRQNGTTKGATRAYNRLNKGTK